MRSFLLVFGLGFSLSHCTTTGDLPEEEMDAEAAMLEAENDEDYMGGETAQMDEISLPAEMVHFDFDSNEIKPEFKETLKAVAAYLKNNPQSTLRVDGHCDEVGTPEYNVALGERRARAVKAFLAAFGIESSRISTHSWGKERPLDSTGSPAGHYKNRRAEFSSDSSESTF